MNSIDQIFLNSGKIVNREEAQAAPLEVKEGFNFQKLNASSLLIPIMLFELLVCVLGAQFYQSIGYKLTSAIILAVTIEAFYMYFSARGGFKAHLIRITLLSISVTTLGYSAYKKDVNVLNKLNLLNQDIHESKIMLSEVTTELKGLKKEKENIEKDMNVFREFKKATTGNKILAPRRLELQQRRSQLTKERKEIKSLIKKRGEELISQSIFSNLGILSIQTLISIIAFTVVQLAICIALPDILSTLKKQ